MAYAQLLPCNLRDQFRQTIDRDHFLRPYVDRAGKIGLHKTPHGFDALVHKQE
jgi:hypothetical protein